VIWLATVAVSQRSSNPPPSQAGRLREQSKQETREALVQAALAEFAERGLDAPSLDSICARAGYTRGAFYVHFADRDDLMAAAMERVIGSFLDIIIATGDAAFDFEKSIHGFANIVSQGEFFTQKSIRAYQIMQACARSNTVRERFVALVTQAAARLSHAVREGQAAGTVRADIDPDSGGRALIGLALGILTLFDVGAPVDALGGADTIIQLFTAPKSKG
jgi:TetR/AcrR family transcriptional regulator, transcriptional repressor for nem operon